MFTGNDGAFKFVSSSAFSEVLCGDWADSQSSNPPEPVMYDKITADSVYRTAKYLRGSRGPMFIDSYIWKQLLSKVFDTKNLYQAVAEPNC